MIENKKPKRILFHRMNGSSAGGSDYSLYYFVRGLDRNKYEPVVIFDKDCYFKEEMEKQDITTILYKSKMEERNRLIKRTSNQINLTTAKNWKVKKIVGSSIRFSKHIPEVIGIIKLIWKYNIDMLHLNLSLPLNRTAILAGLFTNKYIVCHVRSFHKLDKIDLFLSKFISKIICVSNSVKDAYIKQGINPTKLVTIYNGVDTGEFKQLKTKPHKGFIIGSFGRLIEWKGHLNLIYAAKEVLNSFSEVSFIIAGEGPEKEKLIKKTHELGIKDKVRILNTQKDILSFFSGIDIFIYPSIAPDPCPRAVIEAMSAGKLVISTNLGGIPEELGNTGIMLNNARDYNELSKKIIDFLNKDKINDMGKKARERAEKYFDIKTTNQKIEGIFNEILYNR